MTSERFIKLCLLSFAFSLTSAVTFAAHAEELSVKKKLEEGYYWKAGLEFAQSKFIEDNEPDYDDEPPTQLLSSKSTALGVYAARKLTESIWINGGYREVAAQSVSYCNQYDSDDCQSINSKISSFWLTAGYLFYPTVKDFQFEIGLHAGSALTELTSNVGNSSTNAPFLRFTLAVPYKRHWLFQYQADNLKYKTSYNRDLRVSTQGVSIGYLF